MRIATKTFYLALACSVLMPTAVFAELPKLPPVTQVQQAGVVKPGQPSPYPRPVIVVDGHGGGYDTILTKQIDFFFILKGRKPENGKSATGKIFVENYSVNVEDVRAHNVHKITTPVMDVRAWRAVNERVSPIKLCNDELSYQKGAARKKFLKQGGTIRRTKAYKVRAESYWLIKKNRPLLFDPTEKRTFKSPEIMTTVYVKCNPIGNKATKATSTSTRKVTPEEIAQGIAKKRPIGATISVTPKNFLPAGNFTCPARVELFGRVSGRRQFEGHLQYRIGQWNSRKMPVRLKAGAKTSFQARRKLVWQLGGNETKSKNMRVTLVLTNKAGKMRQVIEKDFEIQCQKSSGRS